MTTDKGTGLIHIAPAYGHEDFLVALKHKIPVVRINDIDDLLHIKLFTYKLYLNY